jgi:hypothetical protein
MALFDTSGGLGGLLGDFSDYGIGVPRNTGLIGEADVDAINKRALMSGIINAGLTYAATPKNLGAGNPLPYLGRAGLAGFGASQDVIDRSLNTAYRNRILASRDDNIRTIKQDRFEITQEKQPDGTYKEIARSSLDAPKEQKLNTDVIDVGGKKILINKETGAPIQEYKITGGGLGLKDIYGEPQKDASGKLVYIPKIPGYPARDMGGNIIQGDVQLAEKDAKPPTEEQSKARTFYKRMEGATKVFNSPALDANNKPILDASGKPLTIEQVAGKPEIGAEIAGSLPLVGKVAKRSTESPNRQLYRQAEENWVTANLRKESGAVIGVEEMQQEIEKYFPQIGEGPEVIAQKAEARRIAEEGMKLNANFPTDRQPKQEQQPQSQQKKVVRTGKDKSGKTVVQYSDGSIGYGN